MSTDAWVKTAIERCIEDEDDWLYGAFRRALSITKGRDSLQGYGFEWAVHTALAYSLLRNPDVGKLAIGEKGGDGLKADLSFTAFSQEIIIELKTTERGNMTFAAADVKKAHSQHIAVYYLVFSYPYDEKAQPVLAGAELVQVGSGPLDFRYYLFKRVESAP